MRKPVIPQIVVVTCYGKTETLPRQQALDKYLEAMCGSEGSEHERYESIYFQLMFGASRASDTFNWKNRIS